jgi:hypothetical protein
MTLLVVLSLSFSRLSFGQANSIVGTVIDPSEAPIFGCGITVKDLQAGVVKETETDATGNYIVSYLLPGRYEVAEEAPNFRRIVRPPRKRATFRP